MRTALSTGALLAACVAVSATTSLLVTSNAARADGNAATDGVARLVPYSGRIELDGVPFSGSLRLTFSLYDGAAAVTPAFVETQTVAVHNGDFQVLLGSVTAGLADVLDNADDFYVGIAIAGDESGTFASPIVLAGRQRVLPVPFALWAPEAADFQVNRDLFVARNTDLRGTLAVTGNVSNSGTLTSTGRATLNGGATVGTDLVANGPATLNGATTVNAELTTNGITARGNITAGSGQSAGRLTFANTGESRIQFPSNPFGGVGDFAEIVYGRDGAAGSENTSLVISIQNDADDDIQFWQQGAERLSVRSGSVIVANNLIADNNAHGTCEWTGYTCQPTCPSGRFVAGIRTHGSPNEDCWGGGDYDEPSRSLYCCAL